MGDLALDRTNEKSPDVVVCRESNKAEPSLGPTTPDAENENGDFPLDLTSPLTLPNKLPQVVIFTSQTTADDSSSPKTPADGVFDPFAPGPDDKLRAPQGKKHPDEARPSVARRLVFDDASKGLCCDDARPLSDEKMLESVYENLLEVIVSNQTEFALAELWNAEECFGPCETPPSAPKLNRVAETCPDAPLKPKGKLRSFDFGLCRKLEFES